MRRLLMLALVALVLIGANGCALWIPGPVVYYSPEPIFDTWIWAAPGYWSYDYYAPYGSRPYPGRYYYRPYYGYWR
ncbi:MAG TPA: hypothetical protein PKY10_05500 [Lentisphaeria bacterium]|nr:hypothetical protein [Lentisphaeria bacterium]